MPGGLREPGDCTSPSARRKGPLLTWAPPPGSCGQRGELGDTSKSLSSSASASVRGRHQGPGGGHGCSMPGCPGPYNTRTRREGDLLRRASRPAGWGRYPESLWGLRRRRTPHARPGPPPPADGGTRRTGFGTLLPARWEGPWEVRPGPCV